MRAVVKCKSKSHWLSLTEIDNILWWRVNGKVYSARMNEDGMKKLKILSNMFEWKSSRESSELHLRFPLQAFLLKYLNVAAKLSHSIQT